MRNLTLQRVETYIFFRTKITRLHVAENTSVRRLRLITPFLLTNFKYGRESGSIIASSLYSHLQSKVLGSYETFTRQQSQRNKLKTPSCFAIGINHVFFVFKFFPFAARSDNLVVAILITRIDQDQVLKKRNNLL